MSVWKQINFQENLLGQIRIEKKKKKEDALPTDYHRSHATRDAGVSPRRRGEANYLSKFQKEGRSKRLLSFETTRLCRVLSAKPLILSGLVRFSM